MYENIIEPQILPIHAATKYMIPDENRCDSVAFVIL